MGLLSVGEGLSPNTGRCDLVAKRENPSGHFTARLLPLNRRWLPSKRCPCRHDAAWAASSWEEISNCDLQVDDVVEMSVR